MESKGRHPVPAYGVVARETLKVQIYIRGLENHVSMHVLEHCGPFAALGMLAYI